MTPKEYLKQTDAMKKNINSLEVDLEEMRALSCSVSAVRYGEERINSGTRNTEAPFIRSLERIADMESKIEKAKHALLSLKLDISEAIDLLEDVDERALLRARYVNGKSWRMIAKQMCYSQSTVHRIHSNALMHFSVPN